MRRTIAVLALTAFLAFGGAAAANADDHYTPDEPKQPTLGGSTAVGECIKDAPWIFYDVELVDPDDLATGHTASLIISDATHSVTLPLGTLVDNQLSGRVLWPGASVDASGNPTGWPGWAYENGAWVETSDNYAWTRGDVTAVLSVNPTKEVPLAYPPATPECAAMPAVLSASEELPATGSDFPFVNVAAFAGVIALVGVGLALARPRRAQR
ncbi:cell wall protein [Microbacterium fluvii]|uniref:Cell wall protein n=1 Tax=Microbacterium fluvii TaxID=415215 RepID=A0ABW2HB67_9MICO|nr:cell wall protein [Microbacterium fluvii]MCU4671946.1 cell wall protein [Microbacterium fluvii]